MSAPAAPEPGATSRANARVALLVVGGMLLLALLAGTYAWHTVLVRRGYDVRLPKTQALTVPLIARAALGLYVIVLVYALVRGWNRRERVRGRGLQGESIWSRYATPGLAMLVLLGVGLVLVTIQTRPVRNPPSRDANAREGVLPVLPSQLAALGYLPSDVDLILAVHAAEARLEPAGTALFAQLHSPDGLAGLLSVPSLAGIEPGNLDHLVLGLKLANTVLPQATLVARTIEPYDREALLAKLKASRQPGSGDRQEYYRITLPSSWIKRALLWCPDDRTIVMGTPDASVEHLPFPPRTGVDRFPGPLATMITGSIEAAARTNRAQVWLAGRVEDWNQLSPAVMIAMAALPEDVAKALRRLQTFGFWLQLADDAVLNGVCQATDDAAAEGLQGALDALAGRRWNDDPGDKKKVLLADLSRSWKSSREGPWVKFQANVRPATINSLAPANP
jgi:hypothetical protein